MLHQDGSSHAWVPARWWDRSSPWTMRPARSTRPSSSAKRAPCRASRGCPRRSGPRACLLALRRPRQPLLEHARGRRQGGQGHPDPGRPCASAARHRADRGYCPRPGGRSERMFGTLQKRLPQELRLAGITDMAGANRFLKELFLPQHNARFATPAGDQGSAFVPFTGTLDASASTRNAPSQTTTPCATSAWTSGSPPAAAITSRPGSASTNTPTAQWPSSMDRDVWAIPRRWLQPIQPNPRGRARRDRRPTSTAAPRLIHRASNRNRAVNSST